jgi:hypothetical protein
LNYIDKNKLNKWLPIKYDKLIEIYQRNKKYDSNLYGNFLTSEQSL